MLQRRMAPPQRMSVSERLESLLSASPRRPPPVRWIATQSQPSFVAEPDALNEALHDSVFRHPPPSARTTSWLPQHHPPPFLDSLTRSTLPTASLAPPLAVQNTSPIQKPSNVYQPPKHSPPIIVNSSPPTRSSLDTLRSLSTRSHIRSSPSVSSIRSEPSPSNDAYSLALPFNWNWFQSNKDEIDNLLDEQDRADDIQEERRKIHQRYRAPRHPIVFCHGLLGFDSVSIGPSIAPLQFSHWRGIEEVLVANGAEVLITRVPATSSPADRAKVLEAKIAEVYPGRSVHLIGHSMGGLDCRLLSHRLYQQKNQSFNVLSVTTVATPHRGSAFADYFLDTIGKERIPQVLSLLNMLPNGGGDGKAFECLTRENVRRFNEETPDVPDVHYFSWGASYDPGLIDTWKWSHGVILEKEGPNDGLVSVASSRWGKYMGTLADVNHLDLVGWINTARYKWAEMTGREIKFHPATFYLNVCDMLAREVEGNWDDPGEASPIPSS